MSTKIRTLLSLRKCLRLVIGSFLLVAAILVTLNVTHAPKAFAAFSESCPALQAEGNSGALVQVIQFRLNSLNEDGLIGHHYGNPFPLATDGGFGPLTNEAVRDFQFTWGLGTDGIVGNQTWGTMGFCTGAPGFGFATCCHSSSISHCPGTIEQGSVGTFVEELQRGLNLAFEGRTFAWWPLSTDGDFGPLTKAAVQSLQQEGSPPVPQDGIVGPMTWGVFGMCY